MRGGNPYTNPTRFKSFVLFCFKTLVLWTCMVWVYTLYPCMKVETDFDWLKEWKIILFRVTIDL